MNLEDDKNLALAKTMMKDLENEFQSKLAGQQLEIAFKGLKTSDYINPTRASALYAEIDEEFARSESYANIKKVIHRIVEESLKRGLVSKIDLAHSHI